MRSIFVSVALALVMACAPKPAAAQSTTPRARVEAVMQAFSVGDPVAFEAVAQSNYAPASLARRSPQERAAFVARLSGDFGHFAPATITETAEGIRAEIHGGGELTGVFNFTFDDTPAHLINGLGISVEAGGGHGGGEAALPAPPINAAMSAREMEASLDSWFAPMVARDDFAGVVLIARDGRPIATRTYGDANRATHARPDANTAYNIASIGKIFTHTAIARLIQDGRLTASTTIGDVLPDYPNAEARNATIDQLLNMRGGISDFFGTAFDAADKSAFTSNHAYYTFVSSQPQRFTPGARTEYCNGCYIVLGEIIERVSGMRFEDYLQRNVFAPAHMTRTGYANRMSPPPNTAISYTREPGGPYTDARVRQGYTGSGAGGVHSTARDLLAFDNALREGRLLNPAMTAWVLDGQAAPSGRNMSPLGIAGGTEGTNALLSSNGHWAVIVTANVDPQTPERAGEALMRALQQ